MDGKRGSGGRDGHHDEAALVEQYAALVEAHGDLTEAFGIAAQDIDASYQDGMHAYRSGEYQLASRHFSSLAFLNPRDGQLHLAAGSAMQQLGAHEAALAYFSAAAELMPDDPGTWFRLAESQVALSHDEAGRESLRRCLSLCASGNVRPGLHAHAEALMDRLL
ncbi:tetratricopeptide repeat protein [Trinickia caryophylli]|uniref:Tetratricopeptide repeat-containing protein n=1 Tax=Trinickia caryophylli TaxID=28094 RepID=A0A1X7H6I1_TRICW|nr:tetratricopeptide repeat protein [Trinickia caryophylli]PMS13317.1 tetratricopeptide repeat protein [Trinickia caryophylli]WQE13548.1 tetratricopeptide repeat protein [Trinickia caryophylli]GLU33918.1 hypothetical protein Busp01_37600 [Trinickia caryophylli]SMF80406.1 Tetratricopeptide repeat-containing protein [Trinickia caryophylli]